MCMARLRVYERKILRNIYGPTKENEEWRIRYSRELYRLYDSSDVITDIKSGKTKMGWTCSEEGERGYGEEDKGK
ncbi:hypothetical protein ANN_15249 [Periplaneta americana]|uniref:Uncharacterized protein n=1 Tax=Periplaneta americana TaxID=6978 RepID=A0ABQ8SGY7_PERAM|nr:hypothetical protein ANN_15249 [Periplaneta americana]